MSRVHATRGRKVVSTETAFGRVLRTVRQSRSMSQDELGAKSGYHRTYIGQLERGEKSPSLRTVFNLAETLGVTPSKIVGGVERLLGNRFVTPKPVQGR